MIGIGLWRDQDKAVPSPIGFRRPRWSVPVSELPNGLVDGILEFDQFASVTQRGAVRKNTRHREACTIRRVESREVAHNQRAPARRQGRDRAAGEIELHALREAHICQIQRHRTADVQ